MRIQKRVLILISVLAVCAVLVFAFAMFSNDKDSGISEDNTAPSSQKPAGSTETVTPAAPSAAGDGSVPVTAGDDLPLSPMGGTGSAPESTYDTQPCGEVQPQAGATSSDSGGASEDDQGGYELPFVPAEGN